MALQIRTSAFMGSHWLKLDSAGIELMEPAAWGGRKRLSFGEVDYVLLGSDHVLALQYGTNVFTIKTRPDKMEHRQVIQTLLHYVSAAGTPGGTA